MTVDEQLAILRRGATEIISEEELKAKLAKGKPLRVKLGVDPTARDVTLGWAVVLRKLRDFQRLGHTACLVVGDFTAMIGDPSGKSKTRKQLTREEVLHNVEGVKTQFGKILDVEDAEIRPNSEWLGKMDFEDVLRLCGKVTVAQIMERDDFKKRWDLDQPIGMHELMYPLLQGTDSVALEADVELGGTDQKFNNLMGRQLQVSRGQEAQVVMLMPLLVGLDGKDKMSQSLGNYISIIDEPNEMFGKVMSIPDEFTDEETQAALPENKRRCSLIRNWFELCTDVPMTIVHTLCDAAGRGEVNPKDLKRMLAIEIVKEYHPDEDVKELDRRYQNKWELKLPQPVIKTVSAFGSISVRANVDASCLSFGASGSAISADEYFQRTFSRREQPTDAELLVVDSAYVVDGVLKIVDLMFDAGLVPSKSQAKRLILSGGVSISGERVMEFNARIPLDGADHLTLRVGKHVFRRLQLP